MPVRRFLSALVSLFVSNLAFAGLPWAAGAYVQVPVPDQYTRSKTPPISKSSEYPREWHLTSVNVSEFIQVYGAPTAAYRPATGSRSLHSYLVYSLQDGYYLAVDVPTLEDGHFYAGMLFNPAGQSVGAIIK
jgi:hypothetical protein